MLRLLDGGVVAAGRGGRETDAVRLSSPSIGAPASGCRWR